MPASASSCARRQWAGNRAQPSHHENPPSSASCSSSSLPMTASKRHSHSAINRSTISSVRSARGPRERPRAESTSRRVAVDEVSKNEARCHGVIEPDQAAQIERDEVTAESDARRMTSAEPYPTRRVLELPAGARKPQPARGSSRRRRPTRRDSTPTPHRAARSDLRASGGSWARAPAPTPHRSRRARGSTARRRSAPRASHRERGRDDPRAHGPPQVPDQSARHRLLASASARRFTHIA